VRHKVFEEASSLPMEQEEHEWTAPLQKLQTCYNINADDDDDPRKVNITEIEGQRVLEGPSVEIPFIGQPIKIKKVQKEREKAYHDRHIKKKAFKQGDLVLMYDSKFIKHAGKFRMH
jgi:hypothetical protein